MTNAIERLKELVAKFALVSGETELVIGFIAAANARTDLAKLLEVVERMQRFRDHEEKCQQNQDAGKLKEHVCKRLELLGDVYAALCNLETKETEDA